jgi:dienelactone hydrolase
MRTIKRILLVLGIVVVLIFFSFLIWANTPLRAMPEALYAMQSDSHVQVAEEGWIVFQPTAGRPDTGLIIYPGGRVDPKAYAPVARAIAERGYLVVIVPMPLNLAVLAPDRAEDIIASFPEIQHWVIGGHSLGGAMAARFADQHPDDIQGLFLWAAYPPESNDLSDQGIPVVSLMASLDGLGTNQGIDETRLLLPPEARFVVIEGGNHAQFGWYGVQPGDGEAVISRTDQQAQILSATADMLNQLK